MTVYRTEIMVIHDPYIPGKKYEDFKDFKTLKEAKIFSLNKIITVFDKGRKVKCYQKIQETWYKKEIQ